MPISSNTARTKRSRTDTSPGAKPGGIDPPTNVVPVVEATRGDAVESVHFAAAAVVDSEGKLIASLGDPGLVTYSRSSLKPFQALPTVRRGFPGCFNLEDRHLALICASHSGEERHVTTAGEILRAVGAGEDDLQCGVHVPLFYNRLDGDIPARDTFSPLHNNCSGKHSGMLALAKLIGASKTDYLDFDSPVQRLIREQIGEMLGLEPAAMAAGIDGCSAPNYAVPLQALAFGYARLAASANVTPSSSAEGELTAACARIVAAMREYPEMVSGEGRFDLALAHGTRGRVFSKAGGEAVECVGIPERGWGLAVKVSDGGGRAVGPLVVALLRQLDLLGTEEIEALDSYANPVLKNHRGIAIGALRVVAVLQRGEPGRS